MKSPSQKTILLVEDDPIIALGEAKVLKQFGYAVILANHGEMALQIVSDKSSGVDLILMDIDLGRGMNGIETAKAVLLVRNLPIVYVTSSHEPEIVEKAICVSDYGFLSKNSDKFVLESAIRMAFQLFEAREQTRKIQHLVHVGRWQWDIQHNSAVASAELLRMYAISAEEFAGNPMGMMFERVHPEDRPKVIQVNQAVLDGLAGEAFEFRVVWPDQSVHYLWAEAGETTYDETGRLKYVSGYMQDISERKHAEIDLINQAKIFRQIFEDSQTIMLFIDPLSGAILDANPSAVRFYGYERSVLTAMNIAEINILPPEEVDHARQRAVNEPNNLFVFSHRLANQEIRIVEVYSSPINLPVHSLIESKQVLFSIIHDITERKKAEEDLRKMTRVIAQSPTSIVITDTTGKIEYVNNKFCDLTGYSLAEALGKNPRILKSGVTTEQEYAELYAYLIEGKSWRGEFRNKKKNGELYWENAIIFPIVDDAGKISHFVSIKEDITEFKQMVLDLHAAEERYRALFLSSVDPILLSEPEGTILDANPAAIAKFGYTLEEFLRIGRDQILDTQDPRLARALTERQKIGYFSGELTAMCKDGSHFPCEITTALYYSAQGEPRSSVFLRDITQRKSDEQKLHESEEKYRLLFQNMQEGFALHEIIVDENNQPVDFRFLDANAAYERHSGLKAQDVIGKTILEIMPIVDRRQIEAYGRVALGGPPHEFVYYSTAFERYLHVTAFSPQYGRFATIFEDVTDRKNAEIEIQNLLKEKEILLREVHHRIKNNMATIISLLDAHRHSLTDPANALEDASSRVRSMLTVYDQLYRSEDYVHISTQRYFHELLEQTRLIWEKPGFDVQLNSEIDDLELSSRTMYPIGMIVNEWLTNAYKYAFPDNRSGEIVLKLKAAQPGWLELSVADNGVGIDDSLRIHNPDSFGANLVAILAQQLRAELQVFNQNGTHKLLRIPPGKNDNF